MTSPSTKLHSHRLLNQLVQNLVGLQSDLVRNASSHKAMAQAQSPDIQTLTAFINDATTQYQRRLNWVSEFLSSESKQKVLDAKLGWSESDITDVVEHLSEATQLLQAATKTSYSEIVSLCDQLLSSVSPPESLWPE